MDDAMLRRSVDSELYKRVLLEFPDILAWSAIPYIKVRRNRDKITICHVDAHAVSDQLLQNNKEFVKDIELLNSQVERCNEILKRI